MRKYLFLATIAAAAFASPAAARDGSPYVGVDLGIVFPEDKDVNGSIDFTNNTATRPDIGAAAIGRIRFKTGYDLDLNAGYDFGMFRVEGEVAYKHARVKHFDLVANYLNGINAGSGNTFGVGNPDPGFARNTSVLSGMLNGMVDFGDDAGWSGFAGGGIGVARFHELGESESKAAWQAIAGVRAAVTDNIDVGLKYRYFRSLSRLNFADAAAFAPVGAGSGGTAFINTSQHWSSHSLLLSLSYNFFTAAPPPPPPPPPAPERGL